MAWAGVAYTARVVQNTVFYWDHNDSFLLQHAPLWLRLYATPAHAMSKIRCPEG